MDHKELPTLKIEGIMSYSESNTIFPFWLGVTDIIVETINTGISVVA